ncbi:hypothetical protein C0J50_23172 [Silurus asotus]|uniref:Uncharacterized protein n=1 Tax=Silurus asotus TaxID=30991 RepID=A0AAD5AKL8_SILAS|nr:hypothetical protein C0J50_23172 [Silurus asotus]
MIRSKLHSQVSAADHRHQLQSNPSSKHPFYSGITFEPPKVLRRDRPKLHRSVKIHGGERGRNSGHWRLRSMFNSTE